MDAQTPREGDLKAAFDYARKSLIAGIKIGRHLALIEAEIAEIAANPVRLRWFDGEVCQMKELAEALVETLADLERIGDETADKVQPPKG